ncbi:hypothetical protein Nepgr_018521 [Nepenthes gracilis]|uniref:Uncharacterized protein n=1 Tax=Nepenthes gracilis TaxID=150966 RepID=A0AAD3XUC5_NEPGR|nr:hypothetical protein Nepgr_018521 [Nepenthes gracilis]
MDVVCSMVLTIRSKGPRRYSSHDYSHLQYLENKAQAISVECSSGSTNKLSLVLHKVARAQEVLPDVDEISKAHRSSLEEAISVGFQPKHHSDNNKAENSRHKFEKLVP